MSNRFELQDNAHATEAQRVRGTMNRTLTLSEEEQEFYQAKLMRVCSSVSVEEVINKTICADVFAVLDYLPDACVDLMFADPPYNLSKTFNEQRFHQTSLDDYESWLDSWLKKTARLLKPTASIYICGDWRSSAAIQQAGSRYFKLQNRITWEREKGRGARANWKNCAEDIWFFTSSDAHTFNLENVMLKRQVIAPYTDKSGQPKDWTNGDEGKFRLTHPSNIWTDLTVPFWSMPENTEHPTQKPEKLLAKIILASTNERDVVFDPFLGSGTTSVVAKKLNRAFIGVEIDAKYCCLAEKRLALVDDNKAIQGYADEVFWERNTLALQNKNGQSRNRKTPRPEQPTLELIKA